MSFADFVDAYKKDREARLKESTFDTKSNIIDTKIVPYSKAYGLCSTTPSHYRVPNIPKWF